MAWTGQDSWESYWNNASRDIEERDMPAKDGISNNTCWLRRKGNKNNLAGCGVLCFCCADLT